MPTPRTRRLPPDRSAVLSLGLLHRHPEWEAVYAAALARREHPSPIHLKHLTAPADGLARDTDPPSSRIPPLDTPPLDGFLPRPGGQSGSASDPAGSDEGRSRAGRALGGLLATMRGLGAGMLICTDPVLSAAAEQRHDTLAVPVLRAERPALAHAIDLAGRSRPRHGPRPADRGAGATRIGILTTDDDAAAATAELADSLAGRAGLPVEVLIGICPATTMPRLDTVIWWKTSRHAATTTGRTSPPGHHTQPGPDIIVLAHPRRPQETAIGTQLIDVAPLALAAAVTRAPLRAPT